MKWSMRAGDRLWREDSNWGKQEVLHDKTVGMLVLLLRILSFFEVMQLPVEQWNRLGIGVLQDICMLGELEGWGGCVDVQFGCRE